MGVSKALQTVACPKREVLFMALELQRETSDRNRYRYKPPARVHNESDVVINVVDDDEPPRQIHRNSYISARTRLQFEMFEQWEVTKRHSIERMALEIEELLKLEAELKEAENEYRQHVIDNMPSTSRAIPRPQAAPMASRPVASLDEAPSTSKAAALAQEAASTSKASKVPQTVMAPSTSKSNDQDSKFKSFCGGKTGKRLASSTPIEMRPLKSAKLALASTPFNNNARKSLKFQDKITSNDKNKFVFGDANSDTVQIGPNGTMVSKAALNGINWSMAGAAVTRKLLMEVFDRDTLAFHTLTGKPSPAFIDCNKPLKHQLDAAKVADIVHIMMEKLNMTAKEVRCAITTKCADENKMYRQREQKRLNMAQKIKKEIIN